jgi:polyhydroxyalkanoate synthesis regulator protein
MSELLIKKYPNRRLYDTGRGVYVTLNDLRQLVQGVGLSKSSMPIRKSILLALFYCRC